MTKTAVLLLALLISALAVATGAQGRSAPAPGHEGAVVTRPGFKTCKPPADSFYVSVRAFGTTCPTARRVLTKGRCLNERCGRFRHGPWLCTVKGGIVSRTTRCHRGEKLIIARATGD